MKNYIEFDLDNKVYIATSTTAIGNMALHVNNEPEAVLERRKALAEELNIPFERFTFAYQHNTDLINEVKLEDVSKGVYSFDAGIEGDGLYTELKERPICIIHADCVPIFFYDDLNRTAGIIHVGLQGTVNHAAGTMMKKYLEAKQANPKRIKVFVGPCLQQKSFDLDSEKANVLFENHFTTFITDNHFDMRKANIHDLLSLGLVEENIKCSDIDTYTDVSMFSAKEKTPAGRMMSLIYLK